MIEWYKDKELSIFFDREPQVRMRVITPNMTTFQKHVRMKYPFENMKELGVVLFDHKKMKKYQFTIRKNYCYDGATIPRFLWRLVGSPTDNVFLLASLIHDELCTHHEYVNNDRQFSSKVFERLLRASGVNYFKARVMSIAVDVFQALCGNWRVD